MGNASVFDTVYSEWERELGQVRKRDWFRRIEAGDISLCHYKGYLQETFHNTKFNPQLQAYTTMYFKTPAHDTIKMFYRHASSEIGHDQLALNDLAALGVDTAQVKASRPLADTVAITAFALYQIQFRNPLCYLGYLFHLEFLPTQYGANYLDILKKKGVGDNALTFIDEHSKVDEGHNKMMKQYLQDLVKTPSDLDDVCYSVKSVCQLHGNMICASLENGEKVFLE